MILKRNEKAKGTVQTHASQVKIKAGLKLIFPTKYSGS
jgi:hypothetical protein